MIPFYLIRLNLLEEILVIRHILFFLLLLNIAFSSFASEIIKWPELDQQHLQYVKDIYSGNYEKVKSRFASEYNEDDMVEVYNHAVIYDNYGLHEYCLFCGVCPTCVKSKYIGIPEEFSFKRTTSEKLFKKAMKLGHPYAGYMLYRQGIIAVNNRLTNRDRKRIFRALKPSVDNGDGVAAFMYYYLKGKMRIRPDTEKWAVAEWRKIIRNVEKRLETEAKNGRVLAMFYLAVTYRLQEDYEKSFAWFSVAAKHGHWQSEQYIESTTKELLKFNKAEQAVTYLKKVLNYYGMNLKD